MLRSLEPYQKNLAHLRFYSLINQLRTSLPKYLCLSPVETGHLKWPSTINLKCLFSTISKNMSRLVICSKSLNKMTLLVKTLPPKAASKKAASQKPSIPGIKWGQISIWGLSPPMPERGLKQIPNRDLTPYCPMPLPRKVVLLEPLQTLPKLTILYPQHGSKFVNVHRAPNLLRCRAFEVPKYICFARTPCISGT